VTDREPAHPGDPLDLVLNQVERRAVRDHLARIVAAVGPELALLTAASRDYSTLASKLCTDLLAFVGLLEQIGPTHAGDQGGDLAIDETFAPVVAMVTEQVLQSSRPTVRALEGQWPLLPDEHALWFALDMRATGAVYGNEDEG
jgi:hypothetical protein